MRIPIKKPVFNVFNGKYPAVFFSWRDWTWWFHGLDPKGHKKIPTWDADRYPRHQDDYILHDFLSRESLNKNLSSDDPLLFEKDFRNPEGLAASHVNLQSFYLKTYIRVRSKKRILRGKRQVFFAGGGGVVYIFVGPPSFVYNIFWMDGNHSFTQVSLPIVLFNVFLAETKKHVFLFGFLCKRRRYFHYNLT